MINRWRSLAVITVNNRLRALEIMWGYNLGNLLFTALMLLHIKF